VVGRWTKRSFPARACRLALVSCAILAGGLVPSSAQAMAGLPACEAKSPTIDSVTLKEVTMAGVALEAEINPEGNETSYEFLIVWRALKPRERGEPLPGDPPSQEGHISAGSSDVTVSAFLSGLQPGYTYWYQVIATSLGNNTRSAATALPYFNPDWYYSGYEEGPPYAPPVRAGCLDESGRLGAEETVREQRAKEAAAMQAAAAKEQEEAKARAAAVLADEEAARKHRQEEAAATDTGAQGCVVPPLRGDTLTSVRRTLSKAHCRLGKVSRPTEHHHGQLVVIGQRVDAGSKLPSDARVGVTLGRPLRRW
jgi:hypothetical protein